MADKAASPSKLCLYTLYYPQGEHEAFIHAEIPYLSAAFDEVIIYPLQQSDAPQRELPANVKVHHLALKGNAASVMSRLSLMRSDLGKAAYRSQFRKHFSQAGNLLLRKVALSKHLQGYGEATHYTYWFSDWATILGLLAKEKGIEKYTSRAHGFDLYDERSSLGYQSFREVQLNGLTKVYAVSDMGCKYLRERLPQDRVDRAYLGTADYGLGPMPSDGTLQIISVARAIPLKRLGEILEALKQCASAVHWTHIGEGIELKELQSRAQNMPGHISVEFLGNQSHDAIMSLYQSKGFHLLISLSETEGLPVSMMEAMSFGIPVLATDVGGVKEIVQPAVGQLLPAHIDHQAVAAHIDNWVQEGRSSSQYRAKVRALWEANFSAAKNYPAFVNCLKER